MRDYANPDVDWSQYRHRVVAVWAIPAYSEPYAGLPMIADIMSESFTVLPDHAKIAELASALTAEAIPPYFVISLSDTNFSLVEAASAKALLQRTGDNLGQALFELPLQSLPEFNQPCELVNIEESEQLARSVALRSPTKQVLIVRSSVPVGIVTAPVRGALFGGTLATLYGERYDIFEKGTVSPKYPLTCPHCASTFDFYKPAIAETHILYCCPSCEQVIDQ